MEAKREKDKKIKVLLLSAPMGSGHKMAANALAAAFLRLKKETGLDIVIEEKDVFDFMPSIMKRIMLVGYKLLLKMAPELYSFGYKRGNSKNGSLCMRNFINTCLCLRGEKYLDAVNADIVISTHVTATGVFALYKKKRKKDVFLAAVITDFTVHRWLVCEGTDVYYMADAGLEDDLREILPGGCPIESYGIPLRPEFNLDLSLGECIRQRETYRQKRGWGKNDFVCLLAGGGEGIVSLAEIKKLLREETLKNVRFICVCGRNSGLFKAVTEFCRENDYTDRCEILGFADNFFELMYVSDLLIGKAGGLTVSECLSLGLPMLVYRPLPGQEEANTDFLMQHEGKGVRAARSDKELKEAILHLEEISLAKRLGLRQERCNNYHKAAAEKIVMDVLKRRKMSLKYDKM